MTDAARIGNLDRLADVKRQVRRRNKAEPKLARLAFGDRGWLAIALVIFGFWRPDLTLAGAYLFGGLSSLGLILKARNVDINGSILDALPFVTTIVVLVVMSSGSARRRLGAPAALGVPYQREAR
mgnify:CR=1 FL=1